MRSRKSRDSGAGMTSPPTHQNRLPRISIPNSAQHESALALLEKRSAEIVAMDRQDVEEGPTISERRQLSNNVIIVGSITLG